MQGWAVRGGWLAILAVLLALPVAIVASGAGMSLADTRTGAAMGYAAQPTADACALLTEAEIAAAVGNPVGRGEQYAGPEVCRWDTAEVEEVSVLLMVRLTGSIREQVLCGDLRSGVGQGEPVPGVTDAALWRFSSVGTLFNSGELETCGSKGYVSLDLNGKRDEPVLRDAALTLLALVLGRL